MTCLPPNDVDSDVNENNWIEVKSLQSKRFTPPEISPKSKIPNYENNTQIFFIIN